MIRKIAIVLLSLMGLFILLAVMIPLFVDVDQYRPELQKLANEHIEGKVEVGKLRLDLWGKLSIEIEGLQVIDSNNDSILKVDGAYVHFPFMPLITGKPELKLELIEPQILLKKFKNGDINVATIVKKTKPTDKPSAIETESTKLPKDSIEVNSDQESQEEVAGLPEIVLNAKSSLYIRNSDIRFIDETSEDKFELKRLSVLLDDISLSQTMNIKIWTDVDTKVGDMVVQGPFEIMGTVLASVKDQKPVGFHIDLNGTFTDMGLSIGSDFRKSPGITGAIQIRGDVSASHFKNGLLKLAFHELLLEASGEAAFNPLEYRFAVKQNTIHTNKWPSVIPALKGLFAQNIGLSWTALLKTDNLESLKININTDDSDVSIVGKIENFAKPNIKVSIKSNKLNLDKILPEAEKASENSKPAAAKKGAKTIATNKTSSPPANLDKDLDHLRHNAFLQGLQANLLVNFTELIFSKVKISNLITDAQFKNLKFHLDPLKFNVFDGELKTVADLDLKPQQPTYSLGIDVNNINFEKAVQSQFPSFANTVIGRLSFRANGVGFSLNPDSVLKHLALKGKFSIKEANFATIDVSKMVKDGASEGIQSIRKKWSQIPNYESKSWSDSKVGYKEFSSNFTLKDGAIEAPNFKGEPYPQQGVLIEGYTWIDLIKDRINAKWNVIDVYNKTRLQDVDMTYNGVTVKEILAEPGQPVRLPIKVGCQLSVPCYKFEQIPVHFAGVAGKKVKAVMGQKAKEKLNKVKKEQRAKIKKEGKKLEEKLRNKAKDLFKGKKLPF